MSRSLARSDETGRAFGRDGRGVSCVSSLPVGGDKTTTPLRTLRVLRPERRTGRDNAERVHPLAALGAGLMAALEAELDRQEGGRADLPSLAPGRSARGDLATLKKIRADRTSVRNDSQQTGTDDLEASR